jgi:hypothetical protein
MAMTRYAVVESSTDLRCPDSRVRFYTSLAKARADAAQGGDYTHDDPETARNWHHTFRTIYALPSGWRKPTAAMLARLAQAASTTTYPRTVQDALAYVIRCAGYRVPSEDTT